MVPLDEVEQLKCTLKRGRPCGFRNEKYPTVADILAKPFMRAEGLRRLQEVLRLLGGYWARRGKVETFLSSLGALADGVAIARDSDKRGTK